MLFWLRRATPPLSTRIPCEAINSHSTVDCSKQGPTRYGQRSSVRSCCFFGSGQSIRYSETPATFERISTFCGTELDWLSSYPTNCQQRVVYNGTLPTNQPTTSGVPPRIRLGSFTVSYVCKHTARMYQVWWHWHACQMNATALFFSSKDHSQIEQKLNVDLTLISEWLEVNGLVINPTKTLNVFKRVYVNTI